MKNGVNWGNVLNSGFIILVYEVVQKSFVKTVATVHLKSL